MAHPSFLGNEKSTLSLAPFAGAVTLLMTVTAFLPALKVLAPTGWHAFSPVKLAVLNFGLLFQSTTILFSTTENSSRSKLVVSRDLALLFGAYILFVTFSLVYFPLPWTLRLDFVSRTLPSFVAYLVAIKIISEIPKARIFFENAILLTLSAIAAFAVLEAAGVYAWQLPRQPVGALGGRNFNAAFLVIGLPLVVSRFFGSRKFWVYGPMFSLVCATLLITRSRYAWAICFGELLVLGIFGLRSHKWRDARSVGWFLAFGATSLLAAGLFWWPALRWTESSPYLKSLLRLFDFDSGSGRYRLGEYPIAFRILRDNLWFGIGPNRWFAVVPDYAHVLPERHADTITLLNSPYSDFLRLLVEDGLVGITLLVPALVFFLMRIRRVTYLVCILNCLSFGIFDTPFLRPEILALMPILFALATPDSHSRPVAIPVRYFFGGASAALLITAFASALNIYSLFPLLQTDPQIQDYLAEQERYPNLIFDALAVSRASHALASCNRVLPQRSRSLQYQPNHYLTHFFEARCLAFANQMEKADSAYRKAINLEPHNHIVAYEYSEFRKGHDAWVTALSRFERFNFFWYEFPQRFAVLR